MTNSSEPKSQGDLKQNEQLIPDGAFAEDVFNSLDSQIQNSINAFLGGVSPLVELESTNPQLLESTNQRVAGQVTAAQQAASQVVGGQRVTDAKTSQQQTSARVGQPRQGTQNP
ncbi:MAG: hypothetical protein LBH87_00630, partial [Coriobacteriales bacterium]|nr:hypothetical protein [Coriobacteriales bacterium]